MSETLCDQCGWHVDGGDATCRARFEALLARHYSDARYFRVHRLLVDAYCLQHPDDYCVSAKSLAAHLVGLYWILEDGASMAVGPDRLRRWLSRNPDLRKPTLPTHRGALTIGNCRDDCAPDEWEGDVRKWASSVLRAYHELTTVAEEWKALAQQG